MASSDQQERSAHELMYLTIKQTEGRLRESYEEDVRAELGAADNAAALLALVMSSVSAETGSIQLEKGIPVSGDLHLLQLLALQLVGARALRVMRAARSTLASGYEPESRTHDRILIELREHTRAVLADGSGAEALAWVQGRRIRDISRRMAQQGAADLYANLSQDSHGDPRPLWRLIDAETNVLKLQPERTNATRASLLMHAGLARDQAVMIAQFAGIEIRGLSDLDAAIESSQQKLLEEVEDPG